MATTKATNLGHRSDVTLKGTTTTVESNVVLSDTTTINNTGDDVGLKINSTSTGHIMQLQDSGTDVMVVKDGGNVGIGISNPSQLLSLQSATTSKISMENTGDAGVVLTMDADRSGANAGIGNVEFKWNGTTVGQVSCASGADTTNKDDGDLVFSTTSSGSSLEERMRIDSSGSVLIDKTSSDANTVGFETTDGTTIMTKDGGKPFIANRKTSDGAIVELRKDNSVAGYLASRDTTGLIVNSGSKDGQLHRGGVAKFIWGSNNFYPADDNTYDLGVSSVRFDDIYATNGTIQTSDRNEKQDIEELSEAEQRVALVAKGLLRKFRWKSSVTKKGAEARIHFGIIAQDLQSAFEAEGLDASRYAMFIHSEWWETKETYTDDNGVEHTHTNTFDTEEEAPEGAVKKDRMGVRYSELLAFIIAAI